MPPGQHPPLDDPQGLEAAAGGTEAGTDGGTTSRPETPTLRIGRLSSLLKLASTVSFQDPPPNVEDPDMREMEEAEEMGTDEMLRELATPTPMRPPLRTPKDVSVSMAAPYGPDEPMSLQNALRGTIFHTTYVPSIAQNVRKVWVWEDVVGWVVVPLIAKSDSVVLYNPLASCAHASHTHR